MTAGRCVYETQHSVWWNNSNNDQDKDWKRPSFCHHHEGEQYNIHIHNTGQRPPKQFNIYIICKTKITPPHSFGILLILRAESWHPMPPPSRNSAEQYTQQFQHHLQCRVNENEKTKKSTLLQLIMFGKIDRAIVIIRYTKTENQYTNNIVNKTRRKSEPNP